MLASLRFLDSFTIIKVKLGSCYAQCTADTYLGTQLN